MLNVKFGKAAIGGEHVSAEINNSALARIWGLQLRWDRGDEIALDSFRGNFQDDEWDVVRFGGRVHPLDQPHGQPLHRHVRFLRADGVFGLQIRNRAVEQGALGKIPDGVEHNGIEIGMLAEPGYARTSRSQD